MRALYERLSNERLKELARNLRKRARYQILSTGASSLVTALTYGALAYLVIEHRIGVAEAGAAVAASQQLSGQLSSVVNNMKIGRASCRESGESEGGGAEAGRRE